MKDPLTKHFSDDPQCPCKGAGEPVFVLVNNHKTLDLFDLNNKWQTFNHQTQYEYV